jgi:DNA gyrase/topoisomerase IV subunit A
MNLVMVGLDGKPRQKTLLQILKEWVQFRVTTVRRRTQFRLDKALDRIHILEGRRLVYLNLDDVIAIIREADDPKAALMAKYPLSERQTEDILEIRLRQLARLEGIIPAIESSHAVAHAIRLAKTMKHGSILINLSGRGDKDMDYIIENFGIK